MMSEFDDIGPDDMFLPEYNYHTKMSGVEKALVAGVGVAGVIGVGYYLAKSYSGTGGSCTTKGSACNSALAPYQTEFNACWNNYMSYLNKYIAEDSKAGTGITTEQQSILNQYLSCANTAAKKIAAIAHQYGENPIVIVAYFVGAAVLASAIIYWGSRGGAYYQKYLKGLQSPTGAGSGAQDAAINNAVDEGTLNPADATGMGQSAQTTATQATTDTEDFYTGLADEGLITDAEAQAAIDAEEEIIASDLDEIDVLLL
jgi:hypothetical protein